MGFFSRWVLEAALFFRRGALPMKNLRFLAWLTQFGFSVVSPLVLCLLLALWLRNRFSLGGWVVVLGIFLGVGGAISGLISSLKAMERSADEGKKEPPVSFNDHS